MIKRFLLILMCGVFFMIRPKDSKTYENIETVFNDSYQINLIKDNIIYTYDRYNEKYYTILLLFNDMLTDSYSMPSLGVSLDKETKEMMKKGIWLEFVFEGTNYCEEMRFNSLLVEISPEYYGFNLIRKYNNKYEGRTFYINLKDKNMEKLYHYLNQ